MYTRRDIKGETTMIRLRGKTFI